VLAREWTRFIAGKPAPTDRRVRGAPDLTITTRLANAPLQQPIQGGPVDAVEVVVAVEEKRLCSRMPSNTSQAWITKSLSDFGVVDCKPIATGGLSLTAT